MGPNSEKSLLRRIPLSGRPTRNGRTTVGSDKADHELVARGAQGSSRNGPPGAKTPYQIANMLVKTFLEP